MERKTKITNIVVIALAVTVVFMSIGFAAFTQQLNINGTATVKPAAWKVQFLNGDNDVTYSENSVEPTSKSITETAYNYEITLNRPTDFFEVELRAANTGTIDAKLTQVQMSVSGDTNYSKYLTYSLSYDGTTYTENTTLSSPTVLAAGVDVPVKIRVEYKLPENATDLPATQQTLSISGALMYSAVE